MILRFGQPYYVVFDDKLKAGAGELCVAANLFDIYKKDGKVSYAFRLVFQSYAKTLSDEEVNIILEKVTKALNDIHGYQVR